MKNDPAYKTLLQAIIDEEAKQTGKMYVGILASKFGIEVDFDFKIKKYSGHGQKTAKQLVTRFIDFGGEATRIKLIKATQPVLDANPKIKLNI
ncbi:hypothetical protein HON52_03705 [Candidatus Uhrbacteria bacterium]|jgi:hypothetical protein|nr:hypothetical protein [Candidatus Uhrbacteria bacterium]